MNIPTLTTDRLRLVAPDRDCEHLYQRFYTDAAASKAYGGPLTPAAAWNRLAGDIGAWTLQGFGVWAIRESASAALVGVCGFWQGLGWPKELTWWLLPEARGRGLAQEASAAAIAHACDVWQWDEVRTYLQDENHAARALVLRLGGSRIDRRSFPDGIERDVFSLPRTRVSIRPIQPEEWPVYRDLRLRALQDSPDAFGSSYEAEAARPDEWWASRAAGAFASPTDTALFAWDGGEACGLAWCKLSVTEPGTVDLFQMWVAPGSRGRGVGAALLREVLAHARGVGGTILRLGVTLAESPAMRLYRSFGFEPIGEPAPLREGSNLMARTMHLGLKAVSR